MEIQILTDSSCDLSEEQYSKLDIQIAPLKVHLDEQDFEDGVTIQAKTIYDAMRQGKAPKTSQISPQTFKDIFITHAKENKPLVYIAFSSQLSGTYQTAKMMEQEVKEEYPNAPIHVIDTKCASLGQGLVVLHAAKLAKQGASLDEVIDAVKYQSEHMEHVFTVDDLEYLKRGGRISKAQAFVGTLLKVKPILHVEDGKLVPLEKIRGSKKVLSRMLELMEERGADFTNQTIGISHGDDRERAEQLSIMIQDKFGVNEKQIVIEMVGSVIGAHAGPGTIALFFSNKPKPD
ncbi:DegV family protein [Oceanobacillus sp. Castelsardo]|uniref:DegV family protein n=1 Tax=Oceanobacillus sp. Castelsardo TaxID=1851204 RepID=UPI000838EFA2|nr:DegV family protein [Oceanobacillus sp. Castelsardo]